MSGEMAGEDVEVHLWSIQAPRSFVHRIFERSMMQTVHVLDRSHLQLLAAIREFGRLGDAARSLHLSPSAASHRLAEAERRAGTKLSVATGRTIRLTPAGNHLAQSAVDIEEQINRALLAARWIGSGELERVRVAVGFYDTAGWLLDTFTPVDGRVRVELLRFSDDHLLDALRTGAADLVVAPWPKRPTGLHHVPLARDRLVAAVPADSRFATGGPVTPQALYAETFLTSDYRPSRGFEFHEFFLAAGVVPTTVVQIQSLEMLLRVVGSGGGVTIQPSLVLTWNRPHRTVAIAPLAGPDITVEWVATHRADAGEGVLAAATRIAQAFAAASARGEGAPGPPEVSVAEGSAAPKSD
ncbi:MAG: LysR family transcriptional regulator [Acidimicrobiales bacterium]